MRHIFLLICLSFSCWSARGQGPDLEEAQRRAIVDRSPIILEGVALKTEKYYNRDTTYYYAATLVRIDRVLRGKLRPGTVWVLGEGGGVSKSYEDGQLYTAEAPIDHMPYTVYLKKPAVFFCQPTRLPRNPRQSAADNATVLEFVDAVSFVPGLGSAPVYGLSHGSFRSKGAFYRYLGGFANVALSPRDTIPEPVRPR